ncbi:MAG: hypothetical protein IKM88_13405 [Lachnospiraceae bacterium]|nr:hypothetical protein [Lachnospiraceae bacterium]MBR3736587.1 hypothetical protein [Lachnospiraceae bacterium]MBR6851227.1 hypothetical protein [Lachnospiraceae bacterium]
MSIEEPYPIHMGNYHEYCQQMLRSKCRNRRSNTKRYPEILVHYDPELVKADKNPYVLLHKDGRIVDDAQGYGYKTVQNAKRAFNYKAKQKKTA